MAGWETSNGAVSSRTRRVALRESREDRAPGRVGEGAEDGVELFWHRSITIWLWSAPCQPPDRAVAGYSDGVRRTIGITRPVWAG